MGLEVEKEMLLVYEKEMTLGLASATQGEILFHRHAWAFPLTIIFFLKGKENVNGLEHGDGRKNSPVAEHGQSL